MALEELRVIPVEGEPRTVYRVVASPDRTDEEFIDSFRSSHARGLPPRTGSPEERFGLIHTGISCFETRRQAEKVAIRWGLGDHVAEVQLAPDEGICVAEWGSRGHMTVWGDPVKLADMTVDVVAVGSEP